MNTLHQDPNTPLTHKAEHLFYRSGGAKLSQHNQIGYLKDSIENFPRWIDALENAHTFICIEMYIIRNDHFGQKIRQILIEKAKAGISVLLIYDWFGCLPAHLRKFFHPLKTAGVQLAAYNKPNLISGMGIFSRNHRKSIIIDGQIAFVSGLCMSALWEGDESKGIAPWRDSGLIIQGPAVSDVLAAFIDTWQHLQHKLPENIRATAPQEPIGDASLRIIATTPSNTNMMRLDLTAISMARETLWLTDAYFMPSRMYVQALINAAKDGVDVRILVPRTSDIRWIGTVSRIQYRNLLEAGVRVFEWNGSMIHAKSAIVDGVWARIGSTNLNFSSWFANRELDVVLEGETSVDKLEASFLWDLSQSTEVVLSEKYTTKLTEKRQHTRKSIHRPTHVAARQLAYLSASIDNLLRGNTSQVDEPEMWSYASIAAFTLILAILIFFFPWIIALPFILLLFTGSLVCAIHVYRLHSQLKQEKNLEKIPEQE